MPANAFLNVLREPLQSSCECFAFRLTLLKCIMNLNTMESMVESPEIPRQKDTNNGAAESNLIAESGAHFLPRRRQQLRVRLGKGRHVVDCGVDFVERQPAFHVAA